MSGFVRIVRHVVIAEHLLPELGQGVGISAIERRMRDPGNHSLMVFDLVRLEPIGLSAPDALYLAVATVQRRFGGRNPPRRPFGPPLNTTRGGATFIPSCSNSSCRSRRAAMRETSPCCSGVTNVMLVPVLPARAVRPTRWT